MSQQNNNITTIYQQIFKKVYNQTCGKSHNSWEYFVLSITVYQWLAEHDPIYINNLMYEEITEAIVEIFDIIQSLLEMMKAPTALLPAVIYYANKFVAKTGIKHNQLFNLLLTSTIVTLKFWSESTPINNRIIAEIFDFPVHDINLMERRFLCGVEYQLQLSQLELETFMSKINITSSIKQSSPIGARISSSKSNSFAGQPIVEESDEEIEMETEGLVYCTVSSTTTYNVSPTPANC